MPSTTYKLLDAITANTTGNSFNYPQATQWTFLYTAASITTGGVLQFQASMDNSIWFNTFLVAISSTTGGAKTLTDVSFPFVRCALNNRIDGTFNVLAIGNGN
jgi:hypothetical protein